MKVRTPEELQDRLARALAWRKLEITHLVTAMRTDGPRRDTFVRCGVALLYAHWEGFIREAAVLYLWFVGSQKLTYTDLAPNFAALKVRGRLTAARAGDTGTLYVDAVAFLMDELHNRYYIDADRAVSTRANLSWRVLRDIVVSLGVSFSTFEDKQHRIDECLLKARNEIAHGEYQVVNMTDFEETRAEVLELMDAFRSALIAAAVNGTYRRVASAATTG